MADATVEKIALVVLSRMAPAAPPPVEESFWKRPAVMFAIPILGAVMTKMVTEYALPKVFKKRA